MKIEAAWLERLNAALKRLQEAEWNTKHLVVEAKTMPSTVGSSALQTALRHERFAREEYMRVLRLFTDLVVLGEAPTEEGEENAS